MNKLLTLLAVTLCFTAAQAQYKIDSTFNTMGANEFTQFAGNIVNGDKIAYTATNDVIVAGRWNDQLTVWKYNQNGQLDNSFGQGGLNYIPFPVDNACWVKDVQVQNDGKIVVLAESEWASFSNYAYSQSFIVVARFLANGTRDSSFNGTGVQFSTLVPSYEYHPMCLSVDTAHNTCFVGGWVIDWGSYQCPSGLGHWFIAKYKSNGTLDSSFNSVGFIQQTSFDIAQTTLIPGFPMARVFAIKALPNGKVLAAGAFNPLDSCYFSMRFNANGTYDNSYASNGRSVTHINSFHIMPESSAKILDDESIIYNSIRPTTVIGFPIDTTDMSVYKKDNAGNTQTSFGTGGIVTLHQLSHSISMTVDNEGRIIYTWYNALPAGTQSLYFGRLSATGVTDNNFGTNGILISQPYLNDVYQNGCEMRDIKFNAACDDITLVAWRSASYAPTTFRILNYSLDTLKLHNGVSVIAESNTVTVYPNPTEGRIVIETKNSASYSIYSVEGKLLFFGNLVSGKNELNLSPSLSKGIYFLEIKGEGDFIEKRKIVLE